MKNKNTFIAVLIFISTGISAYAQQNDEAPRYVDTKSNEARDYYNQAHTYHKEKDLKNAAKFYLMAIEADTTYAQAYDNLGLCYRQMGEYEKAIPCYLKSLALFPDGRMAHQNLAGVYRLLKNYEGAEKEYRELIKIAPRYPEGPFGLANLLMTQGKYDEALNYAGAALALYESQKSPLTNEGQHLCGLIYFYKGDIENAKKYLKLAKKNGSTIDPKLVKELRL